MKFLHDTKIKSLITKVKWSQNQLRHYIKINNRLDNSIELHKTSDDINTPDSEKADAELSKLEKSVI